MRITPSKPAVSALLKKAGTLIRKFVSMKTPALIGQLNRVLRGWANYHRFVVSYETFRLIDYVLFQKMWRMLLRRHPNTSKGEIIRKYWSADGRSGTFAVKERNSKGEMKLYRLVKLAEVPIRRHVKIRAKANPYLPEYAGYFWHRRHRASAKQLSIGDYLMIRSLRNNGGWTPASPHKGAFGEA